MYCMYRECNECRSKKIPSDLNESEATQVTWSEWNIVRQNNYI
jgi:hypothetical protein